MSNITDALSTATSLTEQINQLKNQGTGSGIISADPEASLFSLQQSFDNILNNLLYGTGQSTNDNSFLTNASLLEAQISALKENGSSGSPTYAAANTALLTLQQSFNTLIHNFDLLGNEEDEDEEDFNPFASWSNYQSSITNLNNQVSQTGSTDYASLFKNLNSGNSAGLFGSNLTSTISQYGLQAQQYANLDGIF